MGQLEYIHGTIVESIARQHDYNTTHQQLVMGTCISENHRDIKNNFNQKFLSYDAPMSKCRIFAPFPPTRVQLTNIIKPCTTTFHPETAR